jgi:hypothetical protein
VAFTDVFIQSHGNYGGGYGGGGYGGGGGWGGGYEDKMGGLGGGLKTIDWGSQKLERFEKNFYVEDKRVSALTDREVEEFRKSKEIKVYESRSKTNRVIDRFPFRFKDGLFPDLSCLSMRQVFLNTFWHRSVPKAFLRRLPFNVKHGLWH